MWDTTSYSGMASEYASDWKERLRTSGKESGASKASGADGVRMEAREALTVVAWDVAVAFRLRGSCGLLYLAEQSADIYGHVRIGQ